MDIAARFNGEIINGDAMQMYKGLPIITNQIPVSERKGVPHHLISSIDLEQETWTITRFKRETLKLIEDIRSRGKLPVLVGGTHYYAQAVLFHKMLVAEDDWESGTALDPSQEEKYAVLKGTDEEILQKLKEVDPVMAARWHPNETRKIRRSLEIFLQTGRKASDIYQEQQERMKKFRGSSKDELSDDEDSDGESAPGIGQIRFPTLLFWTHSEKETLRKRLDTRLDDMIDSGLLAEAQTMFDYLKQKKAEGVDVDRTRGVWVSIGFKELEPYITELAAGNMSEEELEELKARCVTSIKTATKQYATNQLKWIRNQLWSALTTAGMTHQLYVMDTTDPGAWDTAILKPAERVVEDFLSGRACPHPKELSETANAILTEREEVAKRKENEVIEIRTCDMCKVKSRTPAEWERHLQSLKHRKALKAIAKRAAFEEYKKRMAEKEAEGTNKEEIRG